MNQNHLSNHVLWTLNMFQNPLIHVLGKCRSIDIWSYPIDLIFFPFAKVTRNNVLLLCNNKKLKLISYVLLLMMPLCTSLMSLGFFIIFCITCFK
jgi:hypothetical protein